jgi:hypothetical protein
MWFGSVCLGAAWIDPAEPIAAQAQAITTATVLSGAGAPGVPRKGTVESIF